MKENRKIRSRWLTVRLSEEEEKKLQRLCGQTTAKGLSEYARAILLKEPVIVLYRNASADEFLGQMLGLKAELNAIGNNLNQAVHRLHTLDEIPDIKVWAIRNEISQAELQKKTAEILEKLTQIYTLWSQK